MIIGLKFIHFREVRSGIRDAQWDWGLLNYYWSQADSRDAQILELYMVSAFSMVTRLNMDVFPWRAILTVAALFPPESTCWVLWPLQGPEVQWTSSECISPLWMLVPNKCFISSAIESSVPPSSWQIDVRRSHRSNRWWQRWHWTLWAFTQVLYLQW